MLYKKSMFLALLASLSFSQILKAEEVTLDQVVGLYEGHRGKSAVHYPVIETSGQPSFTISLSPTIREHIKMVRDARVGGDPSKYILVYVPTLSPSTDGGWDAYPIAEQESVRETFNLSDPVHTGYAYIRFKYFTPENFKLSPKPNGEYELNFTASFPPIRAKM